jgi:hypothetical protein
MSKSAARGRESQPTVSARSSGAAPDVLSILQAAVGGPLPIRIRCWDGSVAGEHDAAATVVFVRRRALRRLLWAPNELGLVRAYVSGDAHLEGDIFALLDLPDVIERVAHHQGIGLSSRQRLAAAVSAVRIGAVGPPPRPPAEEIRRRRGRLHSISRDAQSVSHHRGFYLGTLGCWPAGDFGVRATPGHSISWSPASRSTKMETPFPTITTSVMSSTG